MAEEQKQIGFRGTEEYRFWVQRQALDRGLKVQKFLEQAVEAYVGQKHSDARLIDISDEILESTIEKARPLAKKAGVDVGVYISKVLDDYAAEHKASKNAGKPQKSDDTVNNFLDFLDHGNPELVTVVKNLIASHVKNSQPKEGKGRKAG